MFFLMHLVTKNMIGSLKPRAGEEQVPGPLPGDDRGSLAGLTSEFPTLGGGLSVLNPNNPEP